MAAEGAFPKSDGDILYASEVNRFSPKLIDYIEQETSVNVSGTSAYTVIGGSLFYPGAGSLQISEYMRVTMFPTKSSDAGTYNFRIRMSGTAGINMVTTTKATGYASAADVVPLDHFYTSGNITASGGNIGSPYVFFLEGNSNENQQRAYIRDITVTGF